MGYGPRGGVLAGVSSASKVYREGQVYRTGHSLRARSVGYGQMSRKVWAESGKRQEYGVRAHAGVRVQTEVWLWAGVWDGDRGVGYSLGCGIQTSRWRMQKGVVARAGCGYRQKCGYGTECGCMRECWYGSMGMTWSVDMGQSVKDGVLGVQSYVIMGCTECGAWAGAWVGNEA